MDDGMNLRELLESTRNYRNLPSDQLSSHLNQISQHAFVANVVASQFEGTISPLDIQEATDALIKFSDKFYDGDPKAALEFLETKTRNNARLGEMAISEFVELEPKLKLGESNTEHTHWESVIYIDQEHSFSKDTSSKEAERNFQRLENFLDYVENTEQGQEMLKSILSKHCQEKPGANGTNKLTIVLNDNFPSSSDSFGKVSLNVNDPKNTAFIDKTTGEIRPVSFERMAFHELVHATDDKMKIGFVYDKFLLEEYATQKTDEFARNYMPELGQRGVYPNFAGQSPTFMNGYEHIDGRTSLENNEDLRNMISDR